MLELLRFLHRPVAARRNLLATVLKFLKCGCRRTGYVVPAEKLEAKSWRSFGKRKSWKPEAILLPPVRRILVFLSRSEGEKL